MQEKSENAQKMCTLTDTWEDFSPLVNLGHKKILPVYNISLLELSLPTARGISRVGYILSLSTLIVSFGILIGIKILRCHQRNKLHLHLFVSFIIRALMFLAEDGGLLEGALDVGIRFINGDIQLVEITDEDAKSSVACKTFVSVWIYAVMANYSWILIEGLYLHNLIFLALIVPRLSITRYIVLGWSFPLPFLMSWIVLSSTSRNMLCWTESQNPRYFWIIRGPITAAIIMNFILFLNITRVIYVKTFAPQSPRHCRYRNLFRSTMILLPLFGVHYTITTVISIILQKNEKYELTWLQLDQVFSSFQGCVVAFLCCFLNSEVQSALWGLWVKWKTACLCLVPRSKARCRKHSRARLNPQGTESNITTGTATASLPDQCDFCRQENNELAFNKTQETVISFLDLEVRDMEETEMKQCYAGQGSFTLNTVQGMCQEPEKLFTSPSLQSGILTEDRVIINTTQTPTAPLLTPVESPSFEATSDEAELKETVTDMKSNISGSEYAIQEGNQAFATANCILFFRQSQNVESGHRLNFPCYSRTITEESTFESVDCMSKGSEVNSYCQQQTDSCSCCEGTISGVPVTSSGHFAVMQREDNSQGGKFSYTNKILCTCEGVHTSTCSPKFLRGCHDTRTDNLDLNRQCTSNNISDFQSLLADSLHTSDICKVHHLNMHSEFVERIRMSANFAKPHGNENKLTSNVLNDLNDSRMPLCSNKPEQKYRRRSRSEGARWFCSIKKPKVPKGHQELIELNKTDTTIVDRMIETPVSKSMESQEYHGDIKQVSPAIESSMCPVHYNNLIAKSKIEDLKQSFRPRSSSDCCSKQLKDRKYRFHSTSPRIPPEWMLGNTDPLLRNEEKLSIPHTVEELQQNTINEHSIPIESSTEIPMSVIQNAAVKTQEMHHDNHTAPNMENDLG